MFFKILGLLFFAGYAVASPPTYTITSAPFQASPDGSTSGLHRTVNCQAYDRPVKCHTTSGVAKLEPTALGPHQGRCSAYDAKVGGQLTATCEKPFNPSYTYFSSNGPFEPSPDGHTSGLHRDAICQEGDVPILCHTSHGQAEIQETALGPIHGRCLTKTGKVGGYVTATCLRLANTYFATQGPFAASPDGSQSGLSRAVLCRAGDKPIACQADHGVVELQPTALGADHGRCLNKDAKVGGHVTATCLSDGPKYYNAAGPFKASPSGATKELERAVSCNAGDSAEVCNSTVGEATLEASRCYTRHGKVGGAATVGCLEPLNNPKVCRVDKIHEFRAGGKVSRLEGGASVALKDDYFADCDRIEMLPGGDFYFYPGSRLRGKATGTRMEGMSGWRSVDNKPYPNLLVITNERGGQSFGSINDYQQASPGVVIENMILDGRAGAGADIHAGIIISVPNVTVRNSQVRNVYHSGIIISQSEVTIENTEIDHIAWDALRATANQGIRGGLPAACYTHSLKWVYDEPSCNIYYPERRDLYRHGIYITNSECPSGSPCPEFPKNIQIRNMLFHDIRYGYGVNIATYYDDQHTIPTNIRISDSIFLRGERAVYGGRMRNITLENAIVRDHKKLKYDPPGQIKVINVHGP